MTITITKLTTDDLDALDVLMKTHSKTIGFLPKDALRDYLEKEDTLGAKNYDGELVGYLLNASHPAYFRIAQLCVAEDFTGQGIARQLVNRLKKIRTTQKDIRLRCRNDFPAHNMWPKLGFSAIDEQPGKSKDKRPLTLWRLTLAPDDQLGLFQAKTSDESLDVVIDAQIFFDFDEADSDKSSPSKALLSDFLVDTLKLWITDELFNEIAREKDSQQREKSRNRAHEYQEIEYNSRLVEHFEEVLHTTLPSKSESQQSDIRQLAKTSASEVKIFVTRDQALLKKSEEIADRISLRVISPTELIIQLHELSEGQSYAPARIAGFELRWQRISSDEVANFPYNSFLYPGERQGIFREKLDALLAKPDNYKTEFLRSKDDTVAIRVLTKTPERTLIVPLIRLSNSAENRSLFARFVIADSINLAIDESLEMVRFENTGLTQGFEPDLLEMGFTKVDSSFVRFCLSRTLTREQVLSEIDKLYSASRPNYLSMPELELQNSCSPLNLMEANQNNFLIPIRSGYALSLLDRYQSESDLFGGDPSVLLRWDNVYYRSKTQYHMLKAPARILWYVSGEAKQIVAVSSLDKVEIGSAKELFKKFKKFGILEWKDIYKMCSGEPSNEIMALRFSHTFPFRKPVSLSEMRRIFNKHRSNLGLQSPSKISTEIFRELFHTGYPDPS